MDMCQGNLFEEPQAAHSTLSIVRHLKSEAQDFEWFPSTKSQINSITNDIKKLHKDFDFTDRYNESISMLDVGAGDGRVLEQAIEELGQEDADGRTIKVIPYAIEKASIHTSTYRKKGITLLGTNFEETNFVSKKTDICFVNPPYSSFSLWLSNLISQLDFRLLYAIVPERWEQDGLIEDAIKLRGIASVDIIAKSDFMDADRKARCKVHIVRFSFDDMEQLEKRKSRNGRDWRPTLGKSKTTPFQLFIENELNLKQTYSKTTEKFSEFQEKERIKRSMETEGSVCFELVASKGVLWALLENYERDLERVLNQYKKISELDPTLLMELGVDFESVKTGISEKLFGFRNVYWGLLFEQLDAISERLIGKHKTEMLNTLKANSLDFSYKNAIYIVNYAVEIGNEKIEESLTDVFRDLTSQESIKSYFVSNQHFYADNWRYNSDSEGKKKAKYLLDYRFVYSSYQNFSSDSWKPGLNDSARSFVKDLLVVMKLLGYSGLYVNKAFDDMKPGNKLSIFGKTPTGKTVELVAIRMYLNGNKHIKMDQAAMLKFNIVVSRILGWVRSKDEFAQETDIKNVDDNTWSVGDNLKILPSTVLALTMKTAA